MLVQEDFSEMRYYVIELRELPDIMCSSGFFPVYDFSGQQIQDIGDSSKTSDAIFFASIASNTKGVVVFSCHKSSDNTCIQFMRSLDKFTDSELPHALVRFFFNATENLCLSPQWYESLDETVRSALVNRINDWGNPFEPTAPKSLMDDGIEAVDWVVTAREKHLG